VRGLGGRARDEFSSPGIVSAALEGWSAANETNRASPLRCLAMTQPWPLMSASRAGETITSRTRACGGTLRHHLLRLHHNPARHRCYPCGTHAQRHEVRDSGLARLGRQIDWRRRTQNRRCRLRRRIGYKTENDSRPGVSCGCCLIADLLKRRIHRGHIVGAIADLAHAKCFCRMRQPSIPRDVLAGEQALAVERMLVAACML